MNKSTDTVNDAVEVGLFFDTYDTIHKKSKMSL